MKDKKCDSSSIKQFNDGWLQTVSLYKDGCQSFEHRAKAITTANGLPKFIVDGGISRSKFVDSPHRLMMSMKAITFI
jgi:hypothetical protein